MQQFSDAIAGKFSSVNEVMALFPLTREAVDQRITHAFSKTQAAFKSVLEVPAEQRTYANTVGAYEKASHDFSKMRVTVHAMTYVLPDKELLDYAIKAVEKSDKEAIALTYNPDFYRAFCEYLQGAHQTEKLSRDQRYYLDEAMQSFKQDGFALPAEQFDALMLLEQAISRRQMEFQKNIDQDATTLAIPEGGLAGVEPDFVEQLAKDAQGNYILHLDYPTRRAVSVFCTVEATREALWRAVQNRAYPKNKVVLNDLLNLRHQKAQLLGYTSYAQLDIESSMANSVDRVEHFLKDLSAKTVDKAQVEAQLYLNNLPDGVTLSTNGKIKPWDSAYIYSTFVKSFYNYDSREVAQYFPLEKTIEGLFGIYQKVLGLTFSRVTVAGAWHEDVAGIEVRETATGVLRGYVLLDLFSRPSKYSHACHLGIIASQRSSDSDENVHYSPALSLLITNFSKPTAEKPTLLRLGEVSTFFHEFGHAMHQLLGASEVRSLSGTSSVARDFVEMPSQMFEKWLQDPVLLKSLSSHYQTGEQLPDQLISTMLILDKLTPALSIQDQLSFASLALAFHQAGVDKDLDGIYQGLAKTYSPGFESYPDTHWYASFGHLAGYSSRYYGYLWSNVFACNMFEAFKQAGLLSDVVGQRLVTTVLSRAGSEDPNVLIKDFLGREPNQDAFLREIGVL